jgi:hypothetical protein
VKEGKFTVEQIETWVKNARSTQRTFLITIYSIDSFAPLPQKTVEDWIRTRILHDDEFDYDDESGGFYIGKRRLQLQDVKEVKQPGKKPPKRK